VIPKTELSPVIRTDFTNEAAWKDFCEGVTAPSPEGFQAYVEFINNSQYRGLTIDQLLALLPEDFGKSFLFIADSTTFANPERPILVIDLSENPGSTFRVIPSSAWMVENNLSIANMDFSEFRGSAGADGIFRDFE
jgi:hypothetical protein